MKRSSFLSTGRGAVSLAATVAFLVLVNASSLGQNPPAGDPKSAPGRPVELNLLVVDSGDHIVDEVRKEDIRILEGDAEQVIEGFAMDQRPVDYGLAVDMSGSFKPLLGSVLGAVKLLIDHNRPSDRIFIERFISSDKIETMQDFTSDKELLFAGARKLQVEGGQSAVVDAVYLAVDHVARNGRKDARKAVVLITDGDERTSFYTLEKLVKFLHKAEVPVYVLGVTVKLDKEGILKSPRRQAESLLGTIAKESRGRLFLPKNVLELEAATNEVLHGLQRQFLVSYHSTSHDATSDFQEVEVKFADHLKAEKQKIIAPRGYWLKPPSLDPDLKKQKKP